MNEFYLACDESGRLGYVDKSVYENGEITVVAGVIIDAISMPTFSQSVNLIVETYQSITKASKFHITDFEPDIAASVRNEIFSLLKEFGYPLLYGAQYFSAFSRIYNDQKSVADNTRIKQKELGCSVTYPMSHIKKLSQAECFYSLYTKSSCFLAEHLDSPFQLNVLSDEIDNKTLNNYEEQIAKLHNPSKRKALNGKRYIQSTNKVERFSVKSSLQVDSPITSILEASSGSISKECTIHSIVADVIANSVNYYLEQYAKSSDYHHLNIQDAIADHPLAAQFIGLGVESTFTDKLYYHSSA
ncbi:hypothetical protein [Aliivibrio wodanis]|uniref:hypothetical protein n=1 Tax=Aliivibrio wodanis TaxID=80852 RepID=UPI00406BE8E3